MHTTQCMLYKELCNTSNLSEEYTLGDPTRLYYTRAIELLSSYPKAGAVWGISTEKNPKHQKLVHECHLNS